MKSTLAIAALAALTSSIAAEDILRRAVPGNKVVSMDFVKEKRYLEPGEQLPRNRKRGTISESLDNALLLYYADVQVGTPGQKVRIQIDTGSSDVWVESAQSEFCQSSGSPCSPGGTFNPSKSSSFKTLIPNGFQIGYADGTTAEGDYFTDDFSIGGVTISTLQMGIASQTNISEGIMGIGYDDNEAAAKEYPSIVDQMVSQNFINSRAYSLWLNDQESNTGSVLFGGIDTAKYEGNLTGLPLQLEQDQTTPSEFLVVLSGVGSSIKGAAEQSILSNTELGVILDSGSSLMLLPQRVVADLVEQFNGTASQELGAYLVDCSLMNDQTSYVSFQFGGSEGGVEIRVPIEELTNYVISTDNTPLTEPNGSPICQFGIQPQDPSEGDIYLFGDTFLRSAYAVYDLDGQVVYLAQTVFNTTQSNILEIQKSTPSSAGVPDVTGVASGATVQPTSASGLPRAGGATVSGSVVPASATGTPVGTSTGKSAASGRMAEVDVLMFLPILVSAFCVVLGAATI